MKGYRLFLEKVEKLSLEKRKEVIGKILGLNKVIIYTINEENRDIVFRVFDGFKYYRIRVVFEKGVTKKFFEYKVTDISVYCDVFIKNFVYKNDYFSILVKIFVEGNISYFDSFL